MRGHYYSSRQGRRLSFAARQLALPAVVFSACLPVLGQAASLPDAGSLGNQLRQTPSHGVHIPELTTPDIVSPAEMGDVTRNRDSAVRVTLKKIRLTGVPAVVDVPVDAVLHAWTGKPLSFSDLQTLTGTLTGLYRDAGLIAARVIIPKQVIQDGVLTLTILPGEFDKSSFSTGASSSSDDMLARLAATTLPKGEPLLRDRVERLALLLNEVPGVEASVSLVPGEKSGSTSAVIQAHQNKQFGGYVGLDNQGSSATGRSRMVAGVYANGLVGAGDQLRLDSTLGYEHGGLINGRLDYSQLISGYGTRAGAAYSRLDYQYDFMQQNFLGYSDSWEAYVTHPWVRSGKAQANLSATAGQSFLTDKYPGVFSLAGKEGKKTASTGTLGMAGSMATAPGGITSTALSATLGKMRYRDDTARFWNGSDIRGTEGSFFTFNYQLQHEQQIYGPLYASAGVSGQEASGNLDASRKFLLGGPSAVRAYDVGSGAVDRGLIATAELKAKWSLPSTAWLGGSPSFTLGTFYDHGQGQQNRDNTASSGLSLTETNQVKLGGGGLYATVGDAGNYAVTATWAHATAGKDLVSTPQDDDRIWLSVVKTF